MSQRIEYLDSSRGLAALSVVLSHFFGAYGMLPELQKLENTTVHFLWHGEGAVTYFYVLSGYVLSLGFFKGNFINEFNITAYVLRRIFRIFPLFLACLWISFLLLKIHLNYLDINIYLARSSWILELWSSQKSFLEALKESLLVVSIPSISSQRLLPQDWTLKVELIYSSLIPIFILLMNKGKAWFIILFLFFMLSAQFAFIAFVLGIVIARFTNTLSHMIEKSQSWIVLLLLVLGLTLYAAPFNFLAAIMHNHPTRTFIAECLGSSIILVCLIGNKILKNILSYSLLTFLGKISYGIYLTHFFVLIFLVPMILNFMNDFQILQDYHTLWIIALSCLIVISISISFLLFHAIERPFNALGKRVATHISKK